MKVLIIGGGGREHALAWKCARSGKVSEVLVAPGNAGTATEQRVRNVAVPADDIAGLVELATAERVGLTIVGPEAALVAGVVDRFQAHGLPCFGPGAAAAQLEGSKSFSKSFLERHGIPTARYRSFTELGDALAYVRAEGAPIVIKADGLAAGKGVVVAQTLAEAEQAVTGMLGEGRFGAAGRSVVIEECLSGEEASFIVMCDGNSVLPLATSQDHKARDDGDRGPNTGGMGACSPAPVITRELELRIMDEVIEPTLAGLRQDGIDYVGFLYAGLMIGDDGTPRVLEYNCRFGDPETQPILVRLQSDLVLLCEAALAGKLGEQRALWDPRAAVGVVMAAAGYPGPCRHGQVIHGLAEAGSGTSKVFHGGTALRGKDVVTAGGRVLCVVGLGERLRDARESAYNDVTRITFEGAFWRRDIGARALRHETDAVGR